MASSSKYKRPYDVFLSFRGEVRNNFVGHLYNALVQNGIHTFRDSEELRKGDDISMLMNAIEGSCFAIIVFSENYASSTWCLKEVAKIMECKEQKGLEVRPVFYKVDPREVREGRKSYARALTKHESKFKKEIVERWKKALFDAGSLSGWPLNDGDDESKLIQRIVREISTHLSRTPLDVADHPVGLESRVAELKSMLNLSSKDDVLMVGLWGQGGIGKTTLGKAIYNDISGQFEGSSFLADVRENSKYCKGLVTLQEQLLKDTLKLQERLVVSDVARGMNLIQCRLCQRRVLVILDDVDNLDQLRALAGKSNWFGNGSRIFVTTRDSHLLTPRIDRDHVYVYEVKALDDDEARALLSKHAFPAYQKLESRVDLVDGVLNHVKGLPLALEVLGSLLCDTTEDVWESILKKLSRNPNETINNVLKVSYDGLDNDEKEIFLHIACFFKGRAREYTKKVLDSCDLQTAAGFDTLIKRSLIRIEYGNLQMHDLIQLMGRNIVNQDRDDPRRRSMLWMYDDVVDLLSRDMGDCAVKAIVLEPPKPREIYIGPDAFRKMRKLRLLILLNVHNSFQDPVCLPNWLRWLEWPGYPHISEFSSGSKELVGLDMSKSSITELPKQFMDFKQLKYINFSKCKSLVSMPDLSCTPNLEELDLQKCKNLVEVHESVGYHDKLQVLNLKGCSELSVFPNELKSKNLRALHLEKCRKFERFPNIPCKLKGLKSLYLHWTAIKELPTSIENLVSLEIMCLGGCKNLVSLPSSIYKLQNLGDLGLWNCPNLIRFPKYEDSADSCLKTGLSSLQYLDLRNCYLSEVKFLENLSCFPFLKQLLLMGNNITSLPTSINKRDHLYQLMVTDCHQLQEIPELPPLLISLLAQNCESLQDNGGLTSIHDFVRRGLTTAHVSPLRQFLHYDICLPGGEMPEWVLPVEEGSISFMASEDLYDKFLGFALCAVVGNDERRESVSIAISPHVNGRRREYPPQALLFLDLDHISLEFLTPTQLWGVVDFGQIDGNYVQFGLTLSSSDMKKWGFRIICEQLEDDLKVVLQGNQLMDPALLYEVVPESTNSRAESSVIHEDNSTETDLQKGLQDCQTGAEEQSQIVSKRNHDVSPREACEPRPFGLLLRLAEMSMAMFGRCFGS